MKNGSELYPFCIYTIKHSSDLVKRKNKFTENKIWRTGEKLLNNAKDNHQNMVIIFATAEDTTNIHSWGVLKKIDIIEGSQTTYHFDMLENIEHKKRKKWDLKLRSTGNKISHRYIRPYAICHKPDWL